MPRYSMTGRDGKLYTIDGPPGLTKEVVQAEILKRAPQAGVAPQKKSAIEEIPLVGGVLSSVADVPLSFAEGLAGTGKTLTDVFGAGNVASEFLDDVGDLAAQLKSAGSKEDAAAAALIQKEAEDKGIWEQVKAAARAFTYAPLETTASVAGSALPFIAAGVAGAAAAPTTGGASLIPIASMIGLGGASGVGMIKGDIYDAVRDEFVKNGATEEQATAAAERAQEYGGKNTDQIALGGVIGAVASSTGFSRQIASTIGRSAAKRVAEAAAERAAVREAVRQAGGEVAEIGARRGAVRGAVTGAFEEAAPEALQAAQERYAQNVALQREGFDVDEWRGVAGQAAFEGIASLVLGGYGGAREAGFENRLLNDAADEFEAMPPDADEQMVDAATQRFVRRGFNEETATTIVKNMQAQKAAIERQAEEIERQREEARMARTAGIDEADVFAEPDINAPGMIRPEDELTPPPVDEEERAAMERAYTEEVGAARVIPDIEEVAPVTQLREQLGGIPSLTRAQAQQAITDIEQGIATQEDIEARTQLPISEVYAIAEDMTLKYSRRGPRGKDTQTASLGFDMPVQAAPGEAMKRAEFEEFRFAPEEQKAALREQAEQEALDAQERAAALAQKEAEQREETLGDIQYALRMQAPENAVYRVDYDPTDTAAPYKLVAETQLGKKPELVLKADTLQDFSAQIYERMMELTPYIPPSPAGIQEVERIKRTEQPAPTEATRMMQAFTAEVDTAREMGQIDNNQRAQLLKRLQRPDAYRTLPNGDRVPNDAIAKLEADALAAASVVRNASADEKEAAEAAFNEVNQRLRAAVKNSLLNPARAALKTMVENRQLEKEGAAIRVKEAEAEGDVREAREAKIDIKEAKVQKYRKAPAQPAKGVAVDAVQRTVDAITKTWKSKNPVEVVQSIADIKDTKLQRAIARDKAQDAEGFVAPDGTIYLIADNLDSEARVKAVLFHEAIGHLGLEKLFRNNLDQALVAMYGGNAKLKADTDKWRQDNPGAYDADPNPLARAVEEVLAERSEAGKIERGLLQRIGTVIRNFARRMGFTLKISDSDVEAILSMAHDLAVKGETKGVAPKGMRYIKEDRIRVPGEAAKTFLRELGLFSGRELMGMSNDEASLRAARIGIDQEWMDYFMSRRLAARAPEGSEPIKLPQPDMSKYMPKYSRPKVPPKQQAKAAKAAEGLSAGRRRVEDTINTYAMADGLEEATKATPILRNTLAFAEDSSAPVRRAALKSMPTSGITGWLQRRAPVVAEVAEVLVDTIRKMQGLRVNLMAAGDDLVRDMSNFVQQYGSETLARAQFTNRINEIDFLAFDTQDEALANHRLVKAIEASLLKNSNDKVQTRKLLDEVKEQAAKASDTTSVLKDKVKLSTPLLVKMNDLSKLAIDPTKVDLKVQQLAAAAQRIRDSYATKTELAKQKGGLKLYEAERQYHKDILEARQALLDERIERGLGKEQAVRIRDMRARMMRELQSPDERQKAGDLFWDLDADLFDKEYFPMFREGQYWLRVKEDLSKGREEAFYTFNSARELVQARRAVAKRLGENPEDGKVFQEGNDIGELQNTLKETDALMQRVFDIVGKAREDYSKSGDVDMRELVDSIYQTWLMTTPERSARRHFMHAKQIAGFSTNTLENLQKSLATNANELTKLAYAGRVRSDVKAIKETIDDEERPVSEKTMLGDFARELELRAEDELNPAERNAFVNVLNRMSFYYFLTSAKTALTNFANIPIRVVPRFWREYGYAEGTAMWLKYMKMWDSLGRVKMERTNLRFGEYLDAVMPNVNGSNFVKNSADLQWAMKAGTERGILMTTADTMVHNERVGAKAALTGKMADLSANVGKVMSFLFTGTENISRQATYYMAFELEMKKLAKQKPNMPLEERREAALQKALRIVDDTIGNFADWERPRIAKGELTRAFFLFKMHPILQTKFMVGAFRDIVGAPLRGAARQVTGKGKMTKEDTAYVAGALKEFSGVLMMAGLLGGLTALPFYTMMAHALAEGFDQEDDDDVRKLLGMDPRTAYDADIMFRRWIMEHLGTPEKGDVDFADIFINGVPGALSDTEISSTLSLDLVNMWYREPIAGENLESTLIATAIQNIAGLSMFTQMIRGAEAFAEGDIADGLKKLLPAFFRSWVTAYVNETEGVKNRKGDTIIPQEDISGADTLRSMLGARSARLARWQDYYITAKKNEDRIKGEKVDILDDLEQRIDDGEITTQEDFRKFWNEEVVPFNRTYPDPDFLITMESIERSLKGRAQREARTVRGMQVSKKSGERSLREAEPFMP